MDFNGNRIVFSLAKRRSLMGGDGYYSIHQKRDGRITNDPKQQSTEAQLELEYMRRAEKVRKSLDLLMTEDLLAYIKLVNYCHGSYNPRNRLDKETASKLTNRGLMLADWVVPSVVRTVVNATTSVI